MVEATHILIVDDAEFNRELLKAMLEDDNVFISEAENGQVAIELIMAAPKPYDLLLLDINMPIIDGFGVLKFMHEKNLTEDTPVIMISAENATDFMDLAFSLGATDYIPRPFDANVVQRRVRNTIALTRKQRAISTQLRDANMRYMDTIKRISDDIVFYIHLDLDDDSFRAIEDTERYLSHFELDGSIDDMVAKLFELIPQEEARSRAIELFNRESLLQSHEAGQDTVALEHDYIAGDGKRLKLATTVGITSNPITGDLEAIIYSVDVSRAYIRQRMEALLYESAYDGIGVINRRTRIFKTYNAIDNDAYAAFSTRYDNCDYQDCLERGAETVILEQDSAFFLENAAFDNVVRELEDKEVFFFVVRSKTAAGKRSRYSYRYLDDSHEDIILAVEDCTRSSETDNLTGGLNRSGFENAVSMYLASRRQIDIPLSILCINIRGFKAVNDLFGRENGDAVLRQFAKHLEESPLKPYIVARTEGDSFFCLVRREPLTDAAIKDALGYSMRLEGNKTLDIRARCGIYNIHDRALNVTSMCDYAAAALGSIQNEFATPYAVFNTDMFGSYLEHERLLNHIDAAIEAEEFIPYYQPIVDARTHGLVSAEALVRWKSAELGMISPGSFIPALEKSGQISQVDLLIARSVQRMLEKRHASGRHIVPVSTNLSRMDFYDKEMMAALLADTANASVPTSYLRKELTESSYVAFTESQSKVLAELMDLGVPVLLDDFGTGASSVSTVRDFEFSVIKIDMGFTRAIGESPKSDALLRSIVAMAHALGLKTVAEGVETQEQLDFLVDCDCDCIQGYYFSRPLPQEDFERLLDADSIDWSTV